MFSTNHNTNRTNDLIKAFTLILIAFSTHLHAQQKIVIDDAMALSYPYSAVLLKSDKLKINYIKEDFGVTCSVSVEWDESHVETTSQSVRYNKFKVLPLKACLPKTEAWKVLKQLK
ncbi:hypothetical protein PN836_002320 [Ningiella sp. W23]|uniref:hypothetical protein n=1 Tax=Ningiella sp. W23 TaxID=3023715 RepID=UPI0037568CEC